MGQKWAKISKLKSIQYSSARVEKYHSVSSRPNVQPTQNLVSLSDKPMYVGNINLISSDFSLKHIPTSDSVVLSDDRVMRKAKVRLSFYIFKLQMSYFHLIFNSVGRYKNLMGNKEIEGKWFFSGICIWKSFFWQSEMGTFPHLNSLCLSLSSCQS